MTTDALLVSVENAATALGVSPWTVRQFIADGKLPVVKLPSSRRQGEASRRVLIAVSDLQTFVAQHRETTT